MRKVAAVLVGFLVIQSCPSGAMDMWTLERALDHALVKSPDATIASRRMAAAEAVLEQANSSFWPRVQLQSSYSRTDNPMRVFGSILNQQAYKPSLNFNDVPDVDALNTRGVLTMPLYTGGRNLAGRRAALANREAARHESAAIRNALGFEIARAFHTVVKTRHCLGAAESAIRSLRSNLERARALEASGALLKSDVLSIEVRLAEAQEDHIRARNAASLAARGFFLLLGLQAAEATIATNTPDIRIPAPDQGTDRPEISAAQQRTKAAEAQVRNAKSAYLPGVIAFGSVDHDHGWVTQGDGRSYSAGISAQWDLWDGHSTRSKTREAQALLDIAREEERKLRLATDLEIEQARLALSAAQERLAVTAKMVEQADESASLIRKRFSEGMALSLQLIDSETRLLTAQMRRAESESDLNIAIAALRKALALPQLDAATPPH